MEPMDYEDENDSTVVSKETIVFGSGATGASVSTQKLQLTYILVLRLTQLLNVEICSVTNDM
jgi:hypothetical protein